MPIDFQEMTDMTLDIQELSGQLALMQAELQKPTKRLKMVMQGKDVFGDKLPTEERERQIEKAKQEYEKCKEMVEKKVRDLPKMSREPNPNRPQ